MYFAELFHFGVHDQALAMVGGVMIKGITKLDD